jgi:DNA topoisomerase-2
LQAQTGNSTRYVLAGYGRFSERRAVASHTLDCTQVSFVNSICTTKGGTHVTYILDQVTKYVSCMQAGHSRLPEASCE